MRTRAFASKNDFRESTRLKISRARARAREYIFSSGINVASRAAQKRVPVCRALRASLPPALFFFFICTRRGAHVCAFVSRKIPPPRRFIIALLFSPLLAVPRAERHTSQPRSIMPFSRRGGTCHVTLVTASWPADSLVRTATDGAPRFPERRRVLPQSRPRSKWREMV